MEKRYIQRTGGTSFTVSLPKHWVEKYGLHDKDAVELTVQPNGALLIQPARDQAAFTTTVHKIDGLSSSELTREIIGIYLSGADEIVLKGKRLTQPQRTQIRRVAQSLMGMEIIDESSQEVVIRNIFDNSRLSIPQNITQMFVMTQTMFADVMKALSTKDILLAQDVADRDLEIDKLHFIIIRQFRSLITGILSEENTGISLLNCNYYSFVATQLERIADHAVKISEVVNSPTTKSNHDAPELENATKQIVALLKRSEQMVKTINKQTAHTILDEFQTSEKLTALEPIVADSLERVMRYVCNIAEMTIDQSLIAEAHLSALA